MSAASLYGTKVIYLLCLSTYVLAWNIRDAVSSEQEVRWRRNRKSFRDRPSYKTYNTLVDDFSKLTLPNVSSIEGKIYVPKCPENVPDCDVLFSTGKLLGQSFGRKCNNVKRARLWSRLPKFKKPLTELMTTIH